MAVNERRRAELADFLRRRRASVTPEMVGLHTTGRRRTPGLRREEVAELADVGLSWYTWLEQGRDISPSQQVLDALARALRLTPDEHEHLRALAGLGHPARPGTPGPASDLQDIVAGLVPHPAYLLDDKLDVVAHNAPAEFVMADLLTAPRQRRNVLLWLFTGRESWNGLEDRWSMTARANLLDFRAAHAVRAGEPDFERLIEELAGTGEPFTTWWAEHGVKALEPVHKVIRHRESGELRLMLVQSLLPDVSLRLRILLPADQHTRAVLAGRFG